MPRAVSISRGDPSPKLCNRAVVAVTGSIGAIWAAQHVFELRAQGYVREVRVVMSASAAQLVTPAAMRALADSVVLSDLFAADAPYAVGHVQVAEGADVLVVMPATANVLARAAAGFADDAVTATILAAECPVVFVPNMNPRMWRHPLVQRNVRTLTDAGYHVIAPAGGRSAAGGRKEGDGAMPPFETILRGVRSAIGR